MSRAANLEVSLLPHIRPSDETTEMLIKKFLKECSKESLNQYLAENSSYTRRYTKKSILDRQKRMKRRRNAQKHNHELIYGPPVKAKKKKPVLPKRNVQEKSE